MTGRITAVTALGMSGVSPHAVALPDGTTQLYYSSSDGGTAVDACTVAGQCTRQGLLRGVNDLTIVTLVDGTRRGYYAQMDPTTQAKALFTALMSSDGLNFSDSIPLGISSPPEQRAWGVPDAVVMPDGRVRIYWVTMPTTRPDRGEAVASATSTDATGTTFGPDPGYRTTGGVVDFEVLQAKPGNWIAIASTGPGRPPQTLLLAVSTDGLAWKVNRNPLTPASANYLDPTGIPLGPNRFRIYFAKSPKSTPFDGFVLQQGILTVKVR